MYYELTKPQKKIARKIMDKGLDNHYLQGLNGAEKVIEEWKDNKLGIKDAYMKLYKTIERIDNHIARRYNNKGGSRWVEIMAGQLADGVISLDDIEAFDGQVQSVIIMLSGLQR